MPKFYNKDMAELAHQLTLSPRRLRIKQILGVEALLDLVEPDRAYPFEFVCARITGYQKRGPEISASIPGQALVSDLVTLAELISRKASLTVAEVGEPFQTHQELAEGLRVSTKTVRRWRDRGLMGIRLVFEDGVNRLAFLKRTVERFVRHHKNLVEKGASFRQLSEQEREQIVARARELLAKRRVRLHAAARTIAEETGRAVETVRYTLRRYDEANPARALFTGRAESIHTDSDLAVWRAHESGKGAAAIAATMEVSEDDIYAALRRVQLQRWVASPPQYIHNELFDAPQADSLILDAPEPPPSEAEASPRIPKDLPGYLQSLYLTPLLTTEQERDLFRRFNYLKYKAAMQLRSVDTLSATTEEFGEIQVLLARADEVRQRIVRANLRLVVSIAKKHVGWSPQFFEVISDGNVSLLRAVEKFDYALGNKFSTYASWAIMKNYARSIPAEQYQAARYVTGQEELLDAAPCTAPSGATGESSDRRRVQELIGEGLMALEEREREIVRAHFGLGGDGTPLTLEQLGQRFGVTKERVRQIEQRAIERLREVLAPELADSLV
ncbi:MAG: sigma-70 family RNA polymerase sigma factor [Phycisphaerae bacterium]|nr:sigma-70 family RNA polymerase sigma factor [Phycisphaerae bacterium]